MNAIIASPRVKICPRCPEKGTQPVENFNSHSGRRDGHQLYCKPCEAASVAESKARAVNEATSDLIMHRCEKYFHIEPGSIMSTARSKTIARARMAAVWLCRKRFGYSYPELGRLFALDHSTCIHDHRKFESLTEQEPAVGEWAACEVRKLSGMK